MARPAAESRAKFSLALASPLALLLLLLLQAAPTARGDLVSSTTAPAPTPGPSSSPSPSSTDSSSPSPSPSTEAGPPGPGRGRPDMYSLRVESRIAHRYARTLVSSRLANREDRAQEARFSLVLPETAFISAFLIETEGKVYEAYVKEKEAAKQEYEQAVAGGQTAAHVAVSARDSNTFNVAVNVAPGQKVTFNLTYEELLARRLGAYTHAVHVSPGQVVRDLRVDVYIEELRNLTEVRPPAFRAADADADAPPPPAGNAAEENGLEPETPGLSVERTDPGAAHVSFAPSPEQQKAIAKRMRQQQAGGVPDAGAEADAPEGLTGQLVVQYDVQHDPLAGEVLTDQGYFVHFFAPADLPPLRKHVVFVLDVSGSMEGRKVAQLKEAMATILDELNPGDFFNLLEFSYSVTVWNLDSASNNVVYSPYSSPPFTAPGVETRPPPGPEAPVPAAFPATPEYVRKAKEIVSKMTAGGGTNIHDALRTAIAVAHDGLRNASLEGARPEPIIVFLTDGEPTVGESRPHKIFSMVSERNDHPTASLFSLAFGDDADLPFLKKLSLRNAGFARKIYEAADAALQLRNFYRQVASPLLSNVTFEYANNLVDLKSTTKANFPAYFAGSELVVAGRLSGSGSESASPGGVHAQSGTGDAAFPAPAPTLLIRPGEVPAPPEPAPPADGLAPGARKTAPALERLWAYLSIRQLLDEREANSGFEDPFSSPGEPAAGAAATAANLTDAEQEARDAADAAKKRALKLALAYSFVTPLTSLVVVKPNGTSAADLQPEGTRSPGGFGGFAQAQFGALDRYDVNSAAHPAALPLDALAAPAEEALVEYEATEAGLSTVAAAEPPLPSQAGKLRGRPYTLTRKRTKVPLSAPMAPALFARPDKISGGFAGGAAGFPSGFGGGGFGGGAAGGPPVLPANPAWPPPAPYSTTRAPPPPPPPTSLATTAGPTEAAPQQLGSLSDLQWLTNLLNGTTGSLLVPLDNGTRLFRLGVNEDNQPFEACALPEGVSGVRAGGPAHCRHLPHCVLPAITADVREYVRLFCSIGDFAGVCCPDGLPAAGPAAA